MQKLLAIDYGEKRCGIAITDELKIIASPLTTIETKDIFSFLKNIFSSEKIEKTIVGLPKQLNNEESQSEIFIKDFLKKAENEFPEMIFERFDERFSSKIASQSMVLSGIPKKKRQNKSLIDQISATIILQDYLSFQNK